MKKISINDIVFYQFLSDLCGREVHGLQAISLGIFLSDLCGREVIKTAHLGGFFVSKRPVRS